MSATGVIRPVRNRHKPATAGAGYPHLAHVQLDELKRDRKEWTARYRGKDLHHLAPNERRKYYDLFHERVERWLDAGTGSCVLRMPDPRQEMVDALNYFNGKHYRLGTFAVALGCSAWRIRTGRS